MDDCIEKGMEFLKSLEEAGETNHAEIVKGLIDDIKNDYEEEGEEPMGEDESENEYESKDGIDNAKEDGNPDEELDKYANDEIEKKTGKPVLMIHISEKAKK